MVQEKYIGLDKVIKDALVENRGKNVVVLSKEDKIAALERKLETAKLSHGETENIRRQLLELRKRR